MASLPDDHARVIRDVLAGHLGYEGDFVAERLGGLTNSNYLVDAGDRKIVFRIPGAGTEGLVDRAVECAITKVASDIGVDNELLYFDFATGVKAVAYIDNAETMHPETMGEAENIRLAASLLRKLHEDGSHVDFRFDVYEMIPRYEELIFENGTIDWEGYDEMRASLFKLREKMSANNVALCHCDPLCENFVKDGVTGRMYLIDWEYGGMNDPLWDVADVIIESAYDREQRDLFQECYFGRAPTPEEDERVTINIVLIDFLWALWGKQRSYFDHSLDEYGSERYARAQKNFSLIRDNLD